MKRTKAPHRFGHHDAARVALWILIGFGAVACSSSSKSSGSNSNAGNAGASDNGGTSSGGGSSGSAGALPNTAGGGASNGGDDNGGANSGGIGGSSGNGGATAGAGGEPPTGTDAGTDGGVACPADAILCDDFESYMTPADLSAAWKVTETMASVVVDTTKPFAGSTKSLHITSSGDTPVGVIIKENAPLFPIDGNVFYGRMMMWLTEAPTGAVHWNNIQSAGYLPEGSTQWSKYGWGGMYGTILAGYTIRNNPTDMQAVTDCSKPSQLGLPEKGWSCIEWEFDGNGNQMHLWIDNNLVADADIITTGTQCVTPPPPNNTWQAPTFSNLTLGWMQYQSSTTPIELWLDDVVVTTKRRVGCPPRKDP